MSDVPAGPAPGTPVPAEAITAAAEAILAAPYPKVGEGTARNFAVAALRAAWPVLAARAAVPWTRDAIISALAAKFGRHKAYNPQTRDYQPDGNDAEGSCMISEPHEYETVLRALSYGEIADLLAAAPHDTTTEDTP